MKLYYNYITFDISPSTFISDTSHFSSVCSSSVTFNLAMKKEIHKIPELQRPKVIPPIFASMTRHIDPTKIFFTDGSRIEDSSGFRIFNKIYQSSFKLQELRVCCRIGRNLLRFTIY